jgi:hypothetical protein
MGHGDSERSYRASEQSSKPDNIAPFPKRPRMWMLSVLLGNFSIPMWVKSANRTSRRYLSLLDLDNCLWHPNCNKGETEGQEYCCVSAGSRVPRLPVTPSEI